MIVRQSPGTEFLWESQKHILDSNAKQPYSLSQLLSIKAKIIWENLAMSVVCRKRLQLTQQLVVDNIWPMAYVCYKFKKFVRQ